VKMKNSTKWSSLYSTELRFSFTFKSDSLEIIAKAILCGLCGFLILFPWVESLLGKFVLVTLSIGVIAFYIHTKYQSLPSETLNFHDEQCLSVAQNKRYRIGPNSRYFGVGIYLELYSKSKQPKRVLVFSPLNSKKNFSRLSRLVRHQNDYSLEDSI